MATGTRKVSTGASDAGETVKQLTYLAAALKAPRITEAAARLADHARDAGWTHEEYLAAVLDREVAARNASGAQLRIRAAGFAARKTIEEFDWDAQPSVRQQVAALASGGFLTEARNVVLLGPPGTGNTHLATGLGLTPPTTATASGSPPPPTGSPA
jgi:DNA replication protein DnaC